MKQVPFDSDEYLMSFDRKYYLSEKSVKKGFWLQKLGVGCKLKEKINLSSYEMISLLEYNETSPIQFGWLFDKF